MNKRCSICDGMKVESNNIGGYLLCIDCYPKVEKRLKTSLIRILELERMKFKRKEGR